MGLKLHVLGASGSGVTTLGRALSTRLGIPYFDNDDYFWEPSDPPFTVRRDRVLRNAMLLADLEAAGPSWVNGGSMINWGVTAGFDLVVFLFLPPEIRMARLRAREVERYGERIVSDPAFASKHDEFMTWALDYDHDTGIATRTLRSQEEWLKRQLCPVLELRGDLSVEERVEKVVGVISAR